MEQQDDIDCNGNAQDQIFFSSVSNQEWSCQIEKNTDSEDGCRFASGIEVEKNPAGNDPDFSRRIMDPWQGKVPCDGNGKKEQNKNWMQRRRYANDRNFCWRYKEND